MEIQVIEGVNREAIVAKYGRQWELLDGAHRVEHFDNVFTCGLYINNMLSLGYNPKLIMLVAYFHDLFTWERENHHLMSARFVETTSCEFFKDLTPEERQMVADACREHRASYTGLYSSKFSEMMASADREWPGDVGHMLDRAIKFRTSRGMSKQEAWKPAVEHLKEKFGTNGYAKYPAMYEKVFGDELRKQRHEIDNLV